MTNTLHRLRKQIGSMIAPWCVYHAFCTSQVNGICICGCEWSARAHARTCSLWDAYALCNPVERLHSYLHTVYGGDVTIIRMFMEVIGDKNPLSRGLRDLKVGLRPCSSVKFVRVRGGNSMSQRPRRSYGYMAQKRAAVRV